MDSINRSDLRQLVDIEQEPAVSIYFPTHRASADTLQDAIRLKNLTREVENRLEKRGTPSTEIRALLDPLRQLVEQTEFWQHQADGLAIFRTPRMFRSYRLSFPVPELAAVATRLHLKPLLPAVEANQRCCLLALSRDGATVYEVNPQGLREITIPEMPEAPATSRASRRAERQLQAHTASHRSPSRRVAVFHGHGSGEEDSKQTLLAYFRHVDEAIRKHQAGVPMVLAAVDYLCPIYRQASSSSDLLAGEIHGNPAGFTPQELHRQAWDIASSHFQEDRRRAADEYHQLWHTPLASKDIPDVVTASRQGRVKVLFTAVGIQEWGHIDTAGASVVCVSEARAQDQDLLNLAAVETLISGGTVYAVPPGEVPGRGSVAAIFRY